MLLDLVTLQPVHYSWRSYDEIAPALPLAVIGAEDQNFCSHHGFDWKNIDKAMAEHQRHPNKPLRGASTISQQTARTLVSRFDAKLDPQRRRGLSHRVDRRAVAEEAYPHRLPQSRGLGGMAITARRPRPKHTSKPMPRTSRARSRRVWPRSCPIRTTGARTVRGRYVAGRSKHLRGQENVVAYDGLDWCVK